VLGVEEIDPAVLADTVSVVVKYSRDVQRALDALPSLTDPNAALDPKTEGKVPAHPHGHGHDRDHDHDHHPHAADADDAGAKAERAAKDQPGRHDERYYGAPTPATSVASGVRAVPAAQGTRSFAKGLARRRPL
jgi:hypothetical protein